MKTNYLTLLFLFCFCAGFAQTKDSLSLKERQRRQENIQAGNPFKKFGYKPKIATLSDGKYLEFHDLDSIVQIGSFYYYVDKKQITGYITKEEAQKSEATTQPNVPSRWLSPDPLAEEFPSWSPYTFVFNNPIRFVDPDGRAPFDIIITGSASAIGKYKNTVSAATGGFYTVNIDNSGKVSLSATGIGNLGFEMTAEQKAFYKDYSAVVNSTAVIKQEVVENDAGTTVDNWVTGKIDMADVAEFDKSGNGAAFSAGALIHSTVEQHEKAKLGLSSGDIGATSTNANGNTTYTDYSNSHKTAISAENRTNGNYRGARGDENLFYENNGTITKQTITTNSSGGINIKKTKKK